MKTENRKFWVSLLMLAIICALIGYLTFIVVPPGNRDVIITVLSVLLGGASAAMPNLFGSKDDETEDLKEQIVILRNELKVQRAMFDTLREEHERITTQLVSRFAIKKRNKAIKLTSTNKTV
jgi:hypothetical protein